MSDREIDQQLVERATRRQAGIRTACRQVSAQARPAALALHPGWAEVEDVTQEAFIKAYRALPSFRGRARSTPGSTGSASYRQEHLVAQAAGADHDGFDSETRRTSRTANSSGT